MIIFCSGFSCFYPSVCILFRLRYIRYTVMQSDRNSSKTDTFHNPITYKRHVQTNIEQKTRFARHEYGRVGVFRIKISPLLLKYQPLEKCQFSNCSYLIASQCTQFLTNLSLQQFSLNLEGASL